jgi:CheY-like chemotaxis protein
MDGAPEVGKLESSRMPCLLVFTRSEDAANTVGKIAAASGWEAPRADACAPAPVQEAAQNADAALFDLQSPVERVNDLILRVAESSPFLPLIFLNAQGATPQDTGSGLRYHIDPQHVLDLEHVLISLSLAFPMDTFEPAVGGNAVPRVLIVDDNVRLASLIGRTLRALERYDVKVTSSGFEAASILPSFRPDVAVLDLALCDMDGRELCAFIRGHEKLKHTKIIGMSGYISKHRAEEGAVAFDAFIEKPFRMNDILKAVQRFLQ